MQARQAPPLWSASDPPWHYSLLLQGQMTYERLLGLDPDNSDALLGLATVKLAFSNVQQVRKPIEKPAAVNMIQCLSGLCFTGAGNCEAGFQQYAAGKGSCNRIKRAAD